MVFVATVERHILKSDTATTKRKQNAGTSRPEFGAYVYKLATKTPFGGFLSRQTLRSRGTCQRAYWKVKEIHGVSAVVNGPYNTWICNIDVVLGPTLTIRLPTYSDADVMCQNFKGGGVSVLFGHGIWFLFFFCLISFFIKIFPSIVERMYCLLYT